MFCLRICTGDWKDEGREGGGGGKRGVYRCIIDSNYVVSLSFGVFGVVSESE